MGGLLACAYTWLVWRTHLPLSVVSLATLNLATPAALVYLLIPVIFRHASSCNFPALLARGAVSACFFVAAIALASNRVPLGRTLTGCALLLSLGMMVLFWALDRQLSFNIENEGWLVVDAITLVCLLLPRPYFQARVSAA